MTRLGAVLALFGFGSALLHFTSVQFRLLMWAEPWQPFLGLGLGALGAVILLVPALMNEDKPGGPATGYGPPPGAAAPQAAFGQQGFPPASGYGPPPASPPGGFPHQPAYGPPPASPPVGFPQPAPAGQPGGFAPPSGGYPPPIPPPIPPQGPQYGPRPPQGPPPPRGPVQDFGPQGGPPFGPQGR